MFRTHLLLPLFLLAGLAALLVPPSSRSAEKDAVQWLWFDEGNPLSSAPAEARYFRKTFTLDGAATQARLQVAADNAFTVWVNGVRVGAGETWSSPDVYDAARHLRRGKNVLAVEARNDGGPAGLMVRLRGKIEKKSFEVISDRTWKSNKEGVKGWTGVDFDDAKWAAARALGAVGRVQPWGDVLGDGGFTRPTKERFTVPAGFRVLPAVQIPEKDPRFSLVNMCFDARGRLFVSREGGAILLCTKPNKDGVLEEVRPYCEQVKNCQGMCWVDDALLLVGNGLQGTGLYRCRDTKGADRIDSVTQLLRYDGGMNEHGPHAIVHGPDDMLYVVTGNHAHVLPAKLSEHSPLTRWPTGRTGPDQGKPGTTEDVLLPRLNDAHGHAANLLAPGGTIWRLDRDGKNASLVAAGFRNEFDAAFSPDGELFTFDSDMEWDEGLPWYRPVRVCHCPPGAEFGWRTGASKIPPHSLDTLPALCDTGRGSPVGVEVYDHSAFPKKYRGALFVADWSLGRIYAIHMKRNGASYQAEAEHFCTGNPLNVTDLAVGPDGALWFTTGGRGTQGGVFRIVATKPNPPQDPPAMQPLAPFTRAFNRQKASDIMKQNKDWRAEVLPNLERIMKEPDGVRLARTVLINMQNHGMRPDAKLLTALAGNDHAEMRACAVWLLGVNGYPEGKEVLVRTLGDRDALVRRRACEALIRAGIAPPLDSLWPLLGDSDRFVRAAARLVLQRIEPQKWTDRLWTEKRNGVAFEGIVTLCKSNQAAAYGGPIFNRLDQAARMRPEKAEMLDLLRTTQLALIHSTDRPMSARQLMQRINDWFPDRDDLVNRELAIVLTHARVAGLLEHPVHAKILTAMTAPGTDRKEQIHYFYCLRLLGKESWSVADKDRLQTWFEGTKAWTGGFSFTPFLENILRGLQPAFTREDRARALARAGDRPWTALALLRLAPAGEALPPAQLVELYEKLAALKNPPRGNNEMKDQIVEALGKSREPGALDSLRRIAERDPARILAVARVLLRSPASENWKYYVKGVEKANPPTLTSLIEVLKKSPIKPKADEPAPFRAVLSASGRLPEKDRWKAVELLRHWTGNKQFGGETNDWKHELTAWSRWYTQTFPKEPALASLNLTGEGKYRFKDLLAFLESPAGCKGDPARGRVVFEKAQCLKCHKFGKEGEGIGPDLSTVSKRFKRADILESILYPSKVISDQYRSVVIVTTKGQQLNGLAAPQGDTITVLQADGSKVALRKSEIESQFASLVSVMPEKLLDTLTREEIMDLFTFLESEAK